MARLMVVTHGPLAEAIRESGRMFFGKEVDRMTVIGLYPTESPDQLQDKIQEAICQKDDGSGFMIFVDIFGGSPFNMAAMAIEELKEEHRLECFTGVNMPLIMEALSMADEMELEELTAHLEELAPGTIINVRKQLEI